MRFDDFVSKLPIYRHIKNEMVKRSEIRTAAQTLVKLQIDQYVQKHLFAEPRYHDPKRLNRFEYSVFSQFGEDGIIAEIFRRIGETSRFFVEFGVGDGVENNTTYLLTKGWAGAWVEGNSHQVEKIHTRFASVLRDRKLALKQACVTAENAESLLSELSVPQEFDLLSIDYNTYWVWRAISSYRPKAIVVEYNAAFPPGDPWIVAYHPDGAWDGSSHMGASLTSLCALGESKGYRLVGCCFAGSNAFFVREDLLAGLFAAPFTAENHYEPPRFFLYTNRGHRRGWGDFVTHAP